MTQDLKEFAAISKRLSKEIADVIIKSGHSHNHEVVGNALIQPLSFLLASVCQFFPKEVRKQMQLEMMDGICKQMKK